LVTLKDEDKGESLSLQNFIPLLLPEMIQFKTVNEELVEYIPDPELFKMLQFEMVGADSVDPMPIYLLPVMMQFVMIGADSINPIPLDLLPVITQFLIVGEEDVHLMLKEKSIIEKPDKTVFAFS